MRFFRSSYWLIALLLVALPAALAGPVGNYDPFLPAPAPILNAGWVYDQINAAAIPSVDSPYVYNLAAPAVFTITDDFVVGDVYTVTDWAVVILVTGNWAAMPPFGGPGPDPNGWLGVGWAKGQVLLGAGAHNLSVSGNGAGGTPAGFYTRIDTAAVPEPSTLALWSVGLGALCFLRRRKSR